MFLTVNRIAYGNSVVGVRNGFGALPM